MHSLISTVFYVIHYSHEFWRPGLMAFYTVPTTIVATMNDLSS